jgi:hypothetical protein
VRPSKTPIPKHHFGRSRHRQQLFLKMITDEQLGVFSNVLGASIFMLIIVYHYVVAHSKKQEKYATTALYNYSLLFQQNVI